MFFIIIVAMLFCSKARKSNHEKLQSRKSQAQITHGNLFSAGSCSKAANQAQSIFCVRVMSQERHHWKAAVQAAAVMLRTPPSPAGH